MSHAEREHLKAVKAEVAAELRAEALDLEKRATALYKQAEAIEKTWGLRGAPPEEEENHDD
jgi:hypothetical protein